jgi:hypothetical protein
MTDDLLTYPSAQEYITSLVPPREEELQEMEAYAEEHGFPIIGPACGYYCYQLARMIKARSVFELGSGYGYSTAWFAKAVKETCAEQSKDGEAWCITPSGTRNCRKSAQASRQVGKRGPGPVPRLGGGGGVEETKVRSISSSTILTSRRIQHPCRHQGETAQRRSAHH